MQSSWSVSIARCPPTPPSLNAQSECCQTEAGPLRAFKSQRSSEHNASRMKKEYADLC